MNRLLIILLLASFPALAQVSIIPKPVSVSVVTGSKSWNNNIDIVANEKLQTEAELLKEYLKEKEFTSSIKKKSNSTNRITLSLSDQNTNAEGYTLTVNGHGASITAKNKCRCVLRHPESAPVV